REVTGKEGALVTAVDLIRGLGVLAGLEVVEVPGATGWYDTNYEGKRDAALRTLADGADVFLLHVEATDEAGHAGDLEAKVAALEAWDRRILAGLVEGLDDLGPWRLLLLPDHPTPVELRTHTNDAVPYLLVDSEVDGPGGVYSEPATAGPPPVPAPEMLCRLPARWAPAHTGRAVFHRLRSRARVDGVLRGVSDVSEHVQQSPRPSGRRRRFHSRVGRSAHAGVTPTRPLPAHGHRAGLPPVSSEVTATDERGAQRPRTVRPGAQGPRGARHDRPGPRRQAAVAGPQGRDHPAHPRAHRRRARRR